MNKRVTKSVASTKTDIVELISAFASRYRVLLLALAISFIVFIAAWVLWMEREREVLERSSLRVERLQQLYQEWNRQTDGDYRESIGTEILQNAEKIISDYPRRYAAQRALYTRAQYQFQLSEWELAKNDWIQVYEKWPASYLAPLSMFNSAVAEEEMKNYDAALSTLRQLIENWKDAIIIPRALFSLGRIEEKQNNLSEAGIIYDRLIKEYEDSSWALLARNRIIALEIGGVVSGE